jgi:hypothetical protein
MFLLEELIHLKICGSQANLKELHDGFDYKTDYSGSMPSLCRFFLMTCRVLSTGILVKRPKTSKVMRVSKEQMFTDINNCTKWLEFLIYDSNLPARGLSILRREPPFLS